MISYLLHRLLHDVQDMFALRAATKGLQLLFEQGESVPRFVQTDEVKLRQVLINLLNNAIKFTKEGGVAVRIKNEELRMKNEDSESIRNSSFVILNFEIEDSGPGITAEEINTMFEAFGQTETGRQSQEGTGLGLPISRKFVRLMGGDIHVKSQVGEGTTFNFAIQCELADSMNEHQRNGLKSLQPDVMIISVNHFERQNCSS